LTVLETNTSPGWASDATRAPVCTAMPEQARERGDRLELGPEYRDLPRELDMRSGPGHENDVERAFARHLIRDGDVAAVRVPRLRNFHVRSLSPRARRVYPRALAHDRRSGGSAVASVMFGMPPDD
jgi:hypothetical protein